MITLALLTHLNIVTFKQIPLAKAKAQSVGTIKPTKTEITEAFRRAA